MAFKYVTFGLDSLYISSFADERGMVPNIGDKKEDFQYPVGFDFYDYTWEEFVEKANEVLDETLSETIKKNDESKKEKN